MYYRARDKDGAAEPIDDPEADWQAKPIKGEEPAGQTDYAKFMTTALGIGFDAKTAQQKWDEAQRKKQCP